ncbi:hypothetical protein SGFS_051430 [Streptomyces graminofaciens]|uniref:Secreted protein n=1 Tax=Streptomyces graminofaciens TaxID=68212 RepID=A0ABM7FD53_9ACTN|nr:hypothetical protein SGFS_051430 [Streptomyces graminofaciens]
MRVGRLMVKLQMSRLPCVTGPWGAAAAVPPTPPTPPTRTSEATKVALVNKRRIIITSQKRTFGTTVRFGHTGRIPTRSPHADLTIGEHTANTRPHVHLPCLQ